MVIFCRHNRSCLDILIVGGLIRRVEVNFYPILILQVRPRIAGKFNLVLVHRPNTKSVVKPESEIKYKFTLTNVSRLDKNIPRDALHLSDDNYAKQKV